MFKRILSLTVIVCFFLTTLGSLPQAHAGTVLGLPTPGTMVNLSPVYEPVIMKGLTVHKNNPFLFDFIVDVGQDRMSGEPLKKEGEKLIKYFLASLAIPDKDVWVNLSPYEKQRMIPEALGQTDLGRDLLEQDYILKQITASLIYPEKQLGKIFWDKVYAKARQMYGTTQIPVNTFNKVWIMADRAEVFEHNQTAFVVDQHLKVMLEEDYLALQKHTVILSEAKDLNKINSIRDSSATPQNDMHNLGSQIVREIILPQLEKEINTGKNFANLRQIFNSIILASWYKNNLKEALLSQVYVDKSKVNGVKRPNSLEGNEQIYQQYLKAYKKGVFNYVKEDINTATGESMPRKYFSGGIDEAMAANPAMTADPSALNGLASKTLVDFPTLAVVRNDNQASGDYRYTNKDIAAALLKAEVFMEDFDLSRQKIFDGEIDPSRSLHERIFYDIYYLVTNDLNKLLGEAPEKLQERLIWEYLNIIIEKGRPSLFFVLRQNSDEIDPDSLRFIKIIKPSIQVVMRSGHILGAKDAFKQIQELNAIPKSNYRKAIERLFRQEYSLGAVINIFSKYRIKGYVQEIKSIYKTTNPKSAMDMAMVEQKSAMTKLADIDFKQAREAFKNKVSNAINVTRGVDTSLYSILGQELAIYIDNKIDYPQKDVENFISGVLDDLVGIYDKLDKSSLQIMFFPSIVRFLIPDGKGRRQYLSENISNEIVRSIYIRAKQQHNLREDGFYKLFIDQAIPIYSPLIGLQRALNQKALEQLSANINKRVGFFIRVSETTAAELMYLKQPFDFICKVGVGNIYKYPPHLIRYVEQNESESFITDPFSQVIRFDVHDQVYYLLKTGDNLVVIKGNLQGALNQSEGNAVFQKNIPDINAIRYYLKSIKDGKGNEKENIGLLKQYQASLEKSLDKVTEGVRLSSEKFYDGLLAYFLPEFSSEMNSQDFISKFVMPVINEAQKNKQSRLLVGIHGKSGSGKTTTADNIRDCLKQKQIPWQVKTVNFDDFLREKEDREPVDTENPYEKYNMGYFNQFIESLANNEPAIKPIYDRVSRGQLKFGLDENGKVTIFSGTQELAIDFQPDSTGFKKFQVKRDANGERIGRDKVLEAGSWTSKKEIHRIRLGALFVTLEWSDNGNTLMVHIKDSILKIDKVANRFILNVKGERPVGLTKEKKVPVLEVWDPVNPKKREIIFVEGILVLSVSDLFDLSAYINVPTMVRWIRSLSREWKLGRSGNKAEDVAHLNRLFVRESIEDIYVDHLNLMAHRKYGLKTHVQIYGASLPEKILEYYLNGVKTLPHQKISEQYGLDLDKLMEGLEKIKIKEPFEDNKITSVITNYFRLEYMLGAFAKARLTSVEEEFKNKVSISQDRKIATPQLLWAASYEASLEEDPHDFLYSMADAFKKTLLEDPDWLKGKTRDDINKIYNQVESENNGRGGHIQHYWQEEVLKEMIGFALDLFPAWYYFDKAMANPVASATLDNLQKTELEDFKTVVSPAPKVKTIVLNANGLEDRFNYTDFQPAIKKFIITFRSSFHVGYSKPVNGVQHRVLSFLLPNGEISRCLLDLIIERFKLKGDTFDLSEEHKIIVDVNWAVSFKNSNVFRDFYMNKLLNGLAQDISKYLTTIKNNVEGAFARPHTYTYILSKSTDYAMTNTRTIRILLHGVYREFSAKDAYSALNEVKLYLRGLRFDEKSNMLVFEGSPAKNPTLSFFAVQMVNILRDFLSHEYQVVILPGETIDNPQFLSVQFSNKSSKNNTENNLKELVGDMTAYLSTEMVNVKKRNYKYYELMTPGDQKIQQLWSIRNLLYGIKVSKVNYLPQSVIKQMAEIHDLNIPGVQDFIRMFMDIYSIERVAGVRRNWSKIEKAMEAMEKEIPFSDWDNNRGLLIISLILDLEEAPSLPDFDERVLQGNLISISPEQIPANVKVLTSLRFISAQEAREQVENSKNKRLYLTHMDGRAFAFIVNVPGAGVDLAMRSDKEKEENHRHRILIVDDNALELYFLQTQIEKQGYQVEIAMDGLDALAKITANPGKYSFIISDYEMKEMHGLGLLQRLQQDNINIPFIINTSVVPEARLEMTKMLENGGLNKLVDVYEKLDDPREVFNLLEKYKPEFKEINDAVMQPSGVDKASLVPGGIDLNTSNGMQWKVSKDGNGVEMNIDPAMIARIRREGIDSLTPVILKMTPIASVWPLVGLQAPVQAEHLAAA